MTEISTEPVASPAATAPPPAPDPPREQPPTPAPAVVEAPSLAHTPGGIPVLPLALSGTNSTVGAVSAAALAGGGPVALAVAAGGAAVVGVAAAVTNRRRAARTSTARRTSRASGPSRSSGSTSTGGRGWSKSGKSRGRSGRSSGAYGAASGLGRGAGKHRARTTGPRSTGGSSHASRSGAGRIGQVRALRAANKAQAPTRSVARRQATADRRAVADARRDARAAARAAKTPGRGRARRALGWTAGKTASGVRGLVNKARAARDRAAERQVDAKRGAVRKAPARRKARRGLLKSAARFQARRLLAALAGGAAGVLGCLTTPLGRKLGWRWLMHPGRRLYRRLMQSAREQRAARDEEIRAQRTAEEAAADADLNEIKDRVERPARLIPQHAGQEAIHVSGFKFEEAAAEMENAARSYEPDGNMEVLTMIENLPLALQCVANTFRILAERSDEEFAFEKDVAAGFDDIHRTLLNGVDAAETLVPLFRQVHEQDIARHEDPRNGTEAEKGWNV